MKKLLLLSMLATGLMVETGLFAATAPSKKPATAVKHTGKKHTGSKKKRECFASNLGKPCKTKDGHAGTCGKRKKDLVNKTTGKTIRKAGTPFCRRKK